MGEETPKKIKLAYFAAGAGSGPVYRGLALYKALDHLGELGQQIDFTFIIASPYEWLAGRLAPDATVYTLPPAKYSNEAATFLLHQTLHGMPKEERPDHVLVGHMPNEAQAVQDTLGAEFAGVKWWLLMRDFPDLALWLRDFKPERWAGVIGLEPGVADKISPLIGCNCCPVYQVPPALTVWPDEVLDQAEARAYLFAAANRKDVRRDVSLALAVHNGVRGEEVNQIVAQARLATGLHRSHQVLAFSQQRSKAGVGVISLYEPIARYLRAADVLFAAPGHHLYWEWQRYGRTHEAQVIWYPQDRRHDPQADRAAQKVDLDWLRSQPNGAELVIQTVLGGLTNAPA